MLWAPGREPPERQRRLAGLAIAAGAIGVACSTFGATWEASAANGEWQDAVRQESKVSGRTIEMVRYVYEVEAPQAFDLAMITAHAEELERQAAGSEPGSALHSQAILARRAVDAITRDVAETSGMAASNKLAADPKYRTTDGGFDVPQRLRDLQREEWNSRDDADLTAAAGDAHARRARLWTVVMTVSLLPPIAGMTVWYWSLRRERQPVLPWRSWVRRQRLRFAGSRIGRLPATHPREPEPDEAPGNDSTAPPQPEPDQTPGNDSTAPPQPEPDEAPEVGFGAPSPPAIASDGDEVPSVAHRLLAGIGLALGVLATLFTVVQIVAGLAENEALGEAGQHAAKVSATAAGGGVRQAFRDGARHKVALLYGYRGPHVTEPDSIDASAARLAAANAATVTRLDRIIAAMAAPPRREDGLAPPIQAVVSATLADAVAAVEEQHSGVAAAQRAGTRSNTMVISLFAVTLAAIFLDIAAAARPRTRSRYIRMAIGCAVIASIVSVAQPFG